MPQTILAQHNLSYIFIFASISGLILLLINFLMEDPIKYIMFVFEISLTILTYFVLFGKEYRFNFQISRSKKGIDYSLAAFSVVVLTFNYYHSGQNLINLVFSTIVVFFMPGWVFLRLQKRSIIDKPNIASIAISFGISIAFSSIIFLSTFLGVRSEILSWIYVTISFLPIIKDYRFRRERLADQESSTSNYDMFTIATLGWIIVFFLFTISVLYVEMPYVPDLDIVRHFSSAQNLITSPDIYDSQYPWFHYSLAIVLELSSPMMASFQTLIAYLSIVLILTFYIMARAYLIDIDRRAPVIATVIFVAFAGFGWVSFLHVMPGSNSQFNSLQASYLESYWDIGVAESPWLWFWFRPITVGFTVFFTLIYLMREQRLKGLQQIIVISILTVTLGQIHFPELLVFVGLVASMVVFYPKAQLKINETLIGSVIGIVSSIAFSSLQQVLSIDYHPSYTFHIAALVIAAAGLGLSHYKWRPRLSLKINARLAFSILIFLYLTLFLYWFSTLDTFPVSNFIQSLSVPPQYYVALLGVTGILAIPSTIIVFKKYKKNQILMFATLLIFSIALGRIITYFAAVQVESNYWERRIIPFTFSSSAILSTFAIIRMANYFASVRKTIAISFVTLLICGGILSTFLTTEFWISKMSSEKLSNQEIDAINVLNKSDPYSTVLTITDRSKAVAEYSNVGYIIDNYRVQMLPSKSPELPLAVLSTLNSTPIIYLADRDAREMNSKYYNGYIYHLSHVTPITDNNTEIMTLPEMSPATSTSNTVMILPRDGSKFYQAYDILSLGKYNYTTVLPDDINSIRDARTIIVSDDAEELDLIAHKNDYGLNFTKIIILDSANEEPSLSREEKFSLLGSHDYEWIPSGVGTGSIGIPDIHLNVNNSGTDSMKIEVNSGVYKLWQIARSFSVPVDASRYSFVSFRWFGSSDSSWYVIQFNSGNGGSFWYRFQDTWKGWRNVLLPTTIEDGIHSSSGIVFQKVTTNNPTWKEITGIYVKAEASNANHGGTFQLDDLAFANNEKNVYPKSSSIIDNNGEPIVKFPFQIEVAPYDKSPISEAISLYDAGIPFISKRTINNVEVFDVNLVPITRILDLQSPSSREFYPLLGKLLSNRELGLTSYNFPERSKTSMVSGGVAAFKSAQFKGNLTIEATSGIVDLKSGDNRINMNDDAMVLSNVTRIIPVSADKMTIRANAGTMREGSGFYSNISLVSPNITYTGKQATILVVFGDGGIRRIEGSEIHIDLKNADMKLRQPRIESDGTILLNDIYTYGELGNQLNILGKDIQIDGKVSYQVRYADDFIITNHTTFDQDVVYHGVVNNNNEFVDLKSILTMPYPLYLTIAALVLLLLNTRGGKLKVRLGMQRRQDL